MQKLAVFRVFGLFLPTEANRYLVLQVGRLVVGQIRIDHHIAARVFNAAQGPRRDDVVVVDAQRVVRAATSVAILAVVEDFV